jgi:DNA repair photolyase
MHEVEAKGILLAHNRMNIYRGCTHGCTYCDSRSRCYQMNHQFEDIEVKANAPELGNIFMKSWMSVSRD